MVCKKHNLTDRPYRIQILRGLAIIAVVLIHNTPGGMSEVFIRPFLNFGVGLFLFLSGMLSNANQWRPKKRLKKVLIPYIIWTFLYVVMSNVGNWKSIPTEYIIKLITGKAAAPMYYVFVYCELTLLIPIIDKMAKSKARYLGFLISPIEIIIFRLIPLMLGYTMNAYISIIMNISCIGWFTYFYLGYLIGNGLLPVKEKNQFLYLYLVVSILIQFAEGYIYWRLGVINCGTQLKLSSLLTGAIICILAFRFIYESENVHRASRIIKAIGDYSFGIYFSHIAVMRLLSLVSYYNTYVIFPFNAICTIALDMLLICVGRRILGKYSYLLAI